MIQNVMKQMGGIEGFGIFSICLFFAFFAGMLLWAASLKKNYLRSMSDLPLDREPGASHQSNLNGENHHE